MVNIETTEPTLQPGMAERAIDTDTDVSRTITEVSDGLRTAVDRWGSVEEASTAAHTSMIVARTKSERRSVRPNFNDG